MRFTLPSVLLWSSVLSSPVKRDTISNNASTGALLLNAAVSYEICLISLEVVQVANGLGFNLPFPSCVAINKITPITAATSTTTFNTAVPTLNILPVLPAVTIVSFSVYDLYLTQPASTITQFSTATQNASTLTTTATQLATTATITTTQLASTFTTVSTSIKFGMNYTFTTTTSTTQPSFNFTSTTTTTTSATSTTTSTTSATITTVSTLVANFTTTTTTTQSAPTPSCSSLFNNNLDSSTGVIEVYFSVNNSLIGSLYERTYNSQNQVYTFGPAHDPVANPPQLFTIFAADVRTQPRFDIYLAATPVKSAGRMSFYAGTDLYTNGGVSPLVPSYPGTVFSSTYQSDNWNFADCTNLIPSFFNNNGTRLIPDIVYSTGTSTTGQNIFGATTNAKQVGGGGSATYLVFSPLA